MQIMTKNGSLRTSRWPFAGQPPLHALPWHDAVSFAVSCRYIQIPSSSLLFSTLGLISCQQSNHTLMVQQEHQVPPSALANYFPTLHLQTQPNSPHHYHLTTLH